MMHMINNSIYIGLTYSFFYFFNFQRIEIRCYHIGRGSDKRDIQEAIETGKPLSDLAKEKGIVCKSAMR